MSEGAPQMSIVITMGDRTLVDTCPQFPGSPGQVHWELDDPSSVPDMGTKPVVFDLTRALLANRMAHLTYLPFETMSKAELQTALTIERAPPEPSRVRRRGQKRRVE